MRDLKKDTLGSVKIIGVWGGGGAAHAPPAPPPLPSSYGPDIGRSFYHLRDTIKQKDVSMVFQKGE